jgi:N,N'-diacetyllegionaminate synthase
MNQVYIIAEAGVNHNGSLDCAKEMVRIAADSGVDAVKFQTFRAETLVTKSACKAEYQSNATGADETQYEMLKRLELSFSDFQELKACCHSNGVEFLSTPFDLSAIHLLVDLGVRRWKLPSGEITNLPYLRELGRLGQEIILSTGMCELKEIEAAIEVLVDAGTRLSDITVLHCNTQYPTPICDVNLRAMCTLRSALPNLRGVGYSDHTMGTDVSIAAVALGASVIEKHFTLDRTQIGPDHRASLEPPELKQMVHSIRSIELALGSEKKQPSPSELKNRMMARKSIVALKSIAVGEVFTEQNLTVKRPGTGISPMCWDRVLGQVSSRSYSPDDLIDA